MSSAPAPVIIHWEEPNRRNTPPLHIALGGDRFSTLTGVAWLDEFRFVVNHRSGLRLALFDLRLGNAPVVIEPIPHLSDDVAVKQIDDTTWEVAVSGCWEAIYSIYRLTTGTQPKFKLLSTKPHIDKTFCHGVAYDTEGRLCLALHTGEDPRIEIGGKVSRLPKPWGARDICFDADSKRFYAVAVSKNPQLSAYEQTSTTMWSYDADSDAWQSIGGINNMHSDACHIHKGRIWLPDQLNNRVLGIHLYEKKLPIIIKGNYFDFPHGLGISPSGMLAVTNYGSSTVMLLDLENIEQAPNPVILSTAQVSA